MFTFTIALLALIAGYFFYGKFVEKIFGVDPARKTPAYTKQDGVDYIPMPTWKIFMIQFLNIAGLGPIFGAIMGAKFGTASYLWIVLGSIFAGAVHDFLAGMISLRNGGESLPETIGRYLGVNFKQFMRGFTVLLMVLVGAVFVAGPAGLLAKLTPESLDLSFWATVVFVYYVLATLLPIDKIIGKIYPIFAIALIFMAAGILFMIFWHHPALPELTDGIANTHPDGLPIFPMMFISIACGAISGFHATQSPLMARCMKNEKQGHFVFYGAMVAEGIIALIWAAAGCALYEVTGGLNTGLAEALAGGQSAAIYDVCSKTMGGVGIALAMIGVVVCPITSGDTAFRSARLTLSDWFHMDQGSYANRLKLCIPVLGIGAILGIGNATGLIDYTVIWRYFSRTNQTLAMIVLWAAAMYLFTEKKNFWMAAVPATFMSAVSCTYFILAPECLGSLLNSKTADGTVIYNTAVAYPIGIVFAALLLALFIRATKKRSAKKSA